MIADDSLIVRERLGTMFDELAGIEVVGQAGSVAEALSTIHGLQPDIVILDLDIPGGSGLDVLHQIKQNGLGAIVIILTNYTFVGFRQKCMDAGANFFLDKSSEFDQIPHLVELIRWNKI
jgi:DNA-binding NarL/FixJ family response regulator